MHSISLLIVTFFLECRGEVDLSLLFCIFVVIRSRHRDRRNGFPAGESPWSYYAIWTQKNNGILVSRKFRSGLMAIHIARTEPFVRFWVWQKQSKNWIEPNFAITTWRADLLAVFSFITHNVMLSNYYFVKCIYKSTTFAPSMVVVATRTGIVPDKRVQPQQADLAMPDQMDPIHSCSWHWHLRHVQALCERFCVVSW